VSAPGDAPESHVLVNYRLARVEEAIIKLSETTEQLVRLEEKHLETRAALNRAFESIRDLQGRVAAVEHQMPKLTLAMGWVFAGVIAIVALAGGLVWKVSALPIPAPLHQTAPVLPPRG